MRLVSIIRSLLRAVFLPRAVIVAENLALRQQLGILQRSVRRRRLRQGDRILWVWLSQLWPDRRSCLLIVKPETVIRWHRQGVRLYWWWRSKKKPGRPKIDAEIRCLIQRMALDNPTWGAPRIQSELRLLGYAVAESTVARYMTPRRKPPSQTWRTFLPNHIGDIAAIDFFTVPTATFRILFCFVVLRHVRRRVVHFNVTAHPTARWTAQQIIEAFPYEEAPRFPIRNRDGIYGEDFRQRVKHMGIQEVVIAFRSPWQSPFVERLIGSIRRDCLDHVIVLNEAHLRRILVGYFDYYHRSRTHLSLGRNAPVPRPVEPRHLGRAPGRRAASSIHTSGLNSPLERYGIVSHILGVASSPRSPTRAPVQPLCRREAA